MGSQVSFHVSATFGLEMSQFIERTNSMMKSLPLSEMSLSRTSSRTLFISFASSRTCVLMSSRPCTKATQYLKTHFCCSSFKSMHAMMSAARVAGPCCLGDLRQSRRGGGRFLRPRPCDHPGTNPKMP